MPACRSCNGKGSAVGIAPFLCKAHYEFACQTCAYDRGRAECAACNGTGVTQDAGITELIYMTARGLPQIWRTLEKLSDFGPIRILLWLVLIFFILVAVVFPAI